MIDSLKKDGDEWLAENEISYASPAEYIQSAILGLCGCGDPDRTMDYVGEILAKLDTQDWQGYDDDAYMFFVYWANHNDFAEHGTTARCSWLTPKGEELLTDIRTVQEGRGEKE